VWAIAQSTLRLSTKRMEKQSMSARSERKESATRLPFSGAFPALERPRIHVP
jgi:hypothetical protein